jgi:hypothetical protein
MCVILGVCTLWEVVMEFSFKQGLLSSTVLAGVAVALIGGAAPAKAAVCPAFGSDTKPGCGIVITLNANGKATVANGTNTSGGKPIPYDGIEDTLVGIVNNSGGTVNSLSLSAKTKIFAFDGDGIDTYNAPGNSKDTTGYGGPQTFFTAINTAQTSGVANFIGGLASGASTYFSLEEPLTAASFTKVTTAVPEPTSLMIFGAALAGFGLMRRRRKTPA